MSEVKDVRAVLEKMRASQPFLEGTPAAGVVAALWSEGLAACDEYDRLEHQATQGEYGKASWEEGISKGPWQGVRVSVFASILRKAGLLK